MSSIQVTNERVDDIPLILSQLKVMNLPDYFDSHYHVHGNWQGLSLGWTATIWLAHILSQSDHRMLYVEDWVASHQHTLKVCTGQEIRPLDLCDDRLGRVLNYLSRDSIWSAFYTAAVSGWVRTYPLKHEPIRHDSTTISSYGLISEDGLLQKGQSKDHRPDLGQIKAMFSSLDPLGLPVALNVVPGNKADDPLYWPNIQATKAIFGSGLIHVGDCKLAAIDTRARIVAGNDHYLCPLPKVQHEDMAVYLTPVQTGQVTLEPVKRTNAKGKEETIAEGYRGRVHLSHQVDGQTIEWEETQWIVRSFAYAKSQQKALRHRIDQAVVEINQLTVPRQGFKRPQTQQEAEERAADILKQYRVAELITVNCQEITTQRKVRAYRNNPARTITETHLTIKAATNQIALKNALDELGWRIYASSDPAMTMTKAVLLYRQEDIIENIFSRLKGKPLSLSPLYLQRDDHMRGLIRLLCVAVAALTLIEFVVRRELKQQQHTLTGLYGRVKTQRPTAERLLKTFEGITLTILSLPSEKSYLITPLTQTQEEILGLLKFPIALYAQFTKYG